MKKVRALVPVIAAATALVLSGCDIHPGAAAQVGDESISMSTVDDTAASYCSAITRQLEGDHQVIPQNFFRGGIAATLAMRSVAEQLAADYGVEAGQVYENKVSDLEQQTGVLPDDQAQAVVLISSGQDYVTAIEVAIGKLILAAKGTASPSYDDAATAGRQRYAQWISQHGVEFDPSLNVTIDGGKIGHDDPSVSYPVGQDAVSGAAPNPDPDYAAGLPDAHRCG